MCTESAIQGVTTKYCLLKMLTKEKLIDIDCKHVLRAVNITFNDQLMTRVKELKIDFKWMYFDIAYICFNKNKYMRCYADKKLKFCDNWYLISIYVPTISLKTFVRSWAHFRYSSN